MLIILAKREAGSERMMIFLPSAAIVLAFWLMEYALTYD
jgi:hypothetical protein